MSRLRRYAAWVWPAALVASLTVVVAVRLWPRGTPPPAARTDPAEGLAAGRADDLAANARRLRALQDEADRLRRRLEAVLEQAAEMRRQADTLDDMLASGRLTYCPDFLRDDTTVRALQKIIREAAGAAAPAAADQTSLSTAAAVARERLRSKLEAVRRELIDQAARLDGHAAAIRQQVAIQTGQLQGLRDEIREALRQDADP